MKLEGEIAEIDLIERLVELWREGFTGAIRFENEGIIKIIYFKGGDVLSASTNDRADSVDEILMRAGKVTREHVKQALSRRKENETLGDALLNLGFITRKELTWGRRVQAIGVIRSIAAWTTGSFTIVADYLPKREEGTLFPLPQILVELIVTEQDRQRFERLLEGGEAVFEKGSDFDDIYRRLGLNDDADAIVGAIDGRRTAGEVGAASGRDTFNVYKLLHALATLGLLHRAAKTHVMPEVATYGATESADEFAPEMMSFEDAGVADAADAWGLETDPEPPAEIEALPVQQPSAIPTDWSVSGPSFELDTPNVASEPDVEEMQFDTAPEPEWAAPAPEWATPEADASAAAAEPEWAAAPAWQEEPAAVTTPAAVTNDQMPAWDAAPSAPLAVPMIPATPEPAVDATEEQWGFDEAQIETARRASTPAPEPIGPVPAVNPSFARSKRKTTSRRSLLLPLVLLLLLAAVGYGGWTWWLGQQEPESAAVVTPVRRPRPRVNAATATLVPSDTIGSALPAATSTTGSLAATQTNTTASTTTALTATPPPTAPSTASATPRVATATTAPAVVPAPTPVRTAAAPAPDAALPRVTPRQAPANSGVTLQRGSGGAVMTNSGAASVATSAAPSRYDAMAREFASSATGNYTIQLAIICESSNLGKSMKSGGGDIWFVPMSYRGRSCYRLFFGRYDTQAAAKSAVASVPASLRASAPAVVRVPKG